MGALIPLRVMSLQRVTFDGLPVMPWRNGGGVTRELLAWPRADDWAVRISVADIARDGPFSAFSGVERWFAVLAGEGVRLGDPAAEVTADDDALRFDGGDAPACALRGGPTRDLNLMLRGATGLLQRWHRGTSWSTGHLMRGLYTPTAGRWRCAAASRDMFVVDGKANPELSRTGALAIGIPGSVAAFDKLQKLGGKLTFREVIFPVADLAEKGFVISPALAERISATADNLKKFPASAAIYLDKDNNPRSAFSSLQQKDLAATYRAIAKQGPDYFYRGDFAKKTGLVSEMYSPITTGMFGLIIPAFSKAMASNVFPKN